MNLLHIDSSILGPNSVSRELSAAITERLTILNPGITVHYRDFAANPALHISGAHLAAWQGAPVEDAALGQDLALGGTYLEDLFAADIIVIGAPMYNFTVASQLKSWIDRIVVAGKTFKYGPNGPESLLPAGKKVYIASSRGGVYSPGAPAAGLEHHESYLMGVLSFIGLTDITVIRAEGVAKGPDAKAAAIVDAKGEIAQISL